MPIAEAFTSTFGVPSVVFGLRNSAWATFCVLLTRLSTSSCLNAVFHRRAKTFSPARWMTASQSSTRVIQSPGCIGSPSTRSTFGPRLWRALA